MPTKKKAPAAQTEEKVTKPVSVKAAAAKPAAKPEQKTDASVAKAKAPAKAPAAKVPPATTKSDKPVATNNEMTTSASKPKKTDTASKAPAAKKAAEAPASTEATPKAPAPSKPAKAPAAAPEKKPASKASAPAKSAKPAATKAPAPKPAPVERPEPEPIIASTAPESKQAAIQSHALKQAEQRKAAKAQQEVTKAQKPISLPKITTTASRKYEPEFTRSVLDQPNQEPIGPSLRYSDAELQEFRDLITRKLETARKEIAYLHGMITRKDAMTGEDSDSRYMTMEDGSLSMEREQLSQMASRQHDFIEKLENAMVRIENKTYGVCRVTGKLIDKARLRAVPHATLTVEAKKQLSKNPNQQ
jgi:RNA polymerase-binding transcription factor DksA